ncbi:MAG: ATP-binding protein [Candidatus Riflebacteria bacterium]|nr:ATP-binding protein [Candidatus Riflebacteria bacterium]
MFQRRRYFDKIAPFIGKPVIKLITGIRRCGKSSFLKLLIEHLENTGTAAKNILYISMELMEFSFITDHKILYDYIAKKLARGKQKKYLFIDEVQEIPGWEKAVNSILAEDMADIYLTGSNCRLFASEFATLLTGRYIELAMFPLSFEEFLAFRQAQKPATVEDEFARYLKYGGLPGIHHLDLTDEVVFQYIDSIFNTILLKDVVSRYNIRDVFLLEKIAAFLFDNCGNLTSANKIADFLKSQKIKASVDTVHNYISYLVEAFLVYACGRYDLKGKRHLELSDKYYVADPGVRHATLGFRQNDIAGILENIVYIELLRRGYRVTTGRYDALEVDFVARRNDETLYVQVAYLLASEATEKREFRALEQIDDNFPKLVLSMDRVWGKGRNGIRRLYLPDFLLESQ